MPNSQNLNKFGIRKSYHFTETLYLANNQPILAPHNKFINFSFMAYNFCVSYKLD